MLALRRILVALDNSPRAPHVLATAANMAETCGAKLVLLRAIGVPSDLPRDVLAVTDARLEDVLTRNARADLDRMASTLPADRIEGVRVVFGTAWDAICREAKAAEADLIVIGSHGYGGLDRVLGTTAGRVANHADRNVLIVRNT